MRRLILAAIVSLLVCGLAKETRAAEHLSPIETLAFNNFHYEMVNCLAYYQIAIRAVKARGEKEVADNYKKVSDDLLERLFMFGSALGMKDEVATARLRMAMEGQIREIDSDFINVSILIKKYAHPCKAVVQDPDARMEVWLEKAAKEL